MRESKIEKHLATETQQRGGECYKFVSPGRRGVPDRIVLLPVENEEHQRIVARYLRFVEVKQLNAQPEPHQEREHIRLWRLGFSITVLDSIEAIDIWLNQE